MIIQWPLHVLERLLPPGMERTMESSYRVVLVVPQRTSGFFDKDDLYATNKQQLTRFNRMDDAEGDDDKSVDSITSLASDESHQQGKVTTRRRQTLRSSAVKKEKGKASATTPRTTPKRRSTGANQTSNAATLLSSPSTTTKNDRQTPSRRVTRSSRKPRSTTATTTTATATTQTPKVKTTPKKVNSPQRTTAAATTSTPTCTTSIRTVQMNKLKTLTLLSKLSRDAKQDLWHVLVETDDGHNDDMETKMQQHLAKSPKDKATRNLWSFLQEHPTMVETVVQQLRSYAM